MNGSNSQTLHSYEARIKEYIEGTPQTITGMVKDWIDDALSGLPKDATLLELGSAFGRDAAYIASKGFEIDCTDAVAGFVSVLQSRGLKARRYNALLDELENQYDLIFANAVMLHFNRDEFSIVLRKLLKSLKARGRFAFSLKHGRGESWSEEKIGAPRFFCYWERENLAAVLADAGFAEWTIEHVQPPRTQVEWLFVMAYNHP